MMFRVVMTRIGEIYMFCDKFLQFVKIILCCSNKRIRLFSWPSISNRSSLGLDMKAKSKNDRDGYRWENSFYFHKMRKFLLYSY